jgi:hypothetical protein
MRLGSERSVAVAPAAIRREYPALVERLGIIIPDVLASSGTVTVSPSDKGFKSEHCGTWSKSR